MSKIIFTQDIPGEREWLAAVFPGHLNFETESSGKWLADPRADLNELHIYELPWNNPIYDLTTVKNAYKSFFNNDIDIVANDNVNWAYADQFVSTQNFTTFTDQPNRYYLMLHVARSGTVFVESLLQKRYQWQSNHIGISSDYTAERGALEKIIQYQNNITVALVYTTDFWRCLTSNVLSMHYGCHHYNSSFDWNTADPILITEQDIIHIENILIQTWNFWCNLRNMYPSIDFYFLNGAEMISKYNQYTTHKIINYDKTQLIKNYHEAKELFESKYLEKWNAMARRIQRHLTNMGCKVDLDNIQFANESI
jgi:hypothetical protein